jgi:hypothetical protein
VSIRARLERHPGECEVCHDYFPLYELKWSYDGHLECPKCRAPICNGCGNEIDPNLCHCGDLITNHSIHCGHNPVPLGCDCGRAI